MKVIVTGSTGFIGKPLVARLKEDGNDVITPKRSEGFDLRNKSCLYGLPKADVVVHLGAIANVVKSWENPKEIFDVNVNGTINLLEEYCKEHNPFLVYASSYVYGVPTSLPISEDHPISCLNPYATSKYAAEQLCLSYSQRYDFGCASIRAFNPYGPGQPDDLVISKIIVQLVESDEVKISDGSPKRDFLYIDDLIDAYMLVIKDGRSGIYNVGSGESFSINEVISIIAESVGLTNIKVVDEKRIRPNDIRETRADIAKIKKELGWEPEISIREGLRRTYECFKERR